MNNEQWAVNREGKGELSEPFRFLPSVTFFILLSSLIRRSIFYISTISGRKTNL
jgi:hypothetical protein